MTRSLRVRLHGIEVGNLALDASGRAFFSFTDAYMDDEERHTLSQSFEDLRETQTHFAFGNTGLLPTFFENLLPEGVLLELVKNQSGAQANLSVLAYVGQDLPGAVSVASSGDTPKPRGKIHEEATHASLKEQELRFSYAGVQLKFSVKREDKDRFVLPLSGLDGDWIAKLGSSELPDLPKNEFTTMQWAQLAGITVPEHRLIRAAELEALEDRFASLSPAVYLTRRFDRSETLGRIHQEDFCQVLGILPERKYEGISYEKLGELIFDRCGEEDAREFFRRIWFNALVGNTDAHLKNFALWYPDGRRPRLAPAYDLVAVAQYETYRKGPLALRLAGKKRRAAAVDSALVRKIEEQFAQRSRPLPIYDDMRALTKRVIEAWDAVRESASPAYIESIETLHAASPLITTARART